MIVSQTTLTNDLTEAQIEQLADEDRDTQNTWNAYLRDRLAVLESGCFCESDRTWLGHLPDDHEAGSCRCVCDACSDRREWTGYWREAEVEQGKEDEWYAGQLARIRREKRAADGADSDEYLWYKGQLYAIADGKRVEEPWQAEVRAKVEQERLRQEREQLEADRAAAAHRTWLASPEGMVQTAREEAEREDERRERARKRQEKLQREDDWARKNHDRLLDGPDGGLVRATGDGLADVRALVAAASASDYYRMAADPVTGETRDWDKHQPRGPGEDREPWPAVREAGRGQVLPGRAARRGLPRAPGRDPQGTRDRPGRP